jgi:hypothetical protein
MFKVIIGRSTEKKTAPMKYLFNNFSITKIKVWQRQFISLLFLLGFKTIYAGAPFLTDDPVILNVQQWEILLFSTIDKNNDFYLEPDLYAPAVEINYSPSPRLLLHVAAPYAWAIPGAAPPANGIGDIELGIKYQLVAESANMPQIGIAPLLEIPSGNADLNLGNGIPWAKIPIWAQKSWDKWTSYGGGGYLINTAPGLYSYFYAGWLLQRDINEHLSLGGEIFYQGTMTINDRPSVLLNAGGSYNFNNNFSLLATVGRNVVGQKHIIGYLALYWTFGNV